MVLGLGLKGWQWYYFKDEFGVGGIGEIRTWPFSTDKNWWQWQQEATAGATIQRSFTVTTFHLLWIVEQVVQRWNLPYRVWADPMVVCHCCLIFSIQFLFTSGSNESEQLPLPFIFPNEHIKSCISDAFGVMGGSSRPLFDPWRPEITLCATQQRPNKLPLVTFHTLTAWSCPTLVPTRRHKKPRLLRTVMVGWVLVKSEWVRACHTRFSLFSID